MSEGEVKRFQSSNKCWICDKSFDTRDNKVRDHCHVTGKYRGSAHLICNINLKLTQKFQIILKKYKILFLYIKKYFII